MDTNKKYRVISTAAVLGAILACINLQAAPVSPHTATDNSVEAGQLHRGAYNDTTEADSLRNAYRLLSQGGNGNEYNGHRTKAMEHLEAAAKLLGTDLKDASAPAGEQVSQGTSESNLQQAKTLLQNIEGTSNVKNQPRVAKHIRQAISQIDDALARQNK